MSVISFYSDVAVPNTELVISIIFFFKHFISSVGHFVHIGRQCSVITSSVTSPTFVNISFSCLEQIFVLLVVNLNQKAIMKMIRCCWRMAFSRYYTEL